MSLVSSAAKLAQRRLRPDRWIVAGSQPGRFLVHRRCRFHHQKYAPGLDCSSGTVSTRLPADNEMVQRNVRQDIHGNPASLYGQLGGAAFFFLLEC